MEPDQFAEEKFDLFHDYQRHVHHEGDGDITRSGFRRFLCDSPLARRLDSDGKQLGSYHQCYRLDGRLIAMSVLDLLPHAVSGVYFLYHQDFEKWAFGKLSALREASLAREGGYRYYYMGYYIHSCRKMRYKGDFQPQFVLDLDSFSWHPLDDEMRHLMDTKRYASPSKEQRRLELLQQSVRHTGEAHEDGTPNRALIDALDDVLYPAPSEAANSGLSLLQLGMPGVTTLEKLRAETALDRIRVFTGRKGGRVYETQACLVHVMPLV